MTNSTNKPTMLFWIISVVALIWNAMGANAYIQQAYNTEAHQAMYTPEQLEIANNTPSWAIAMFAIAVFGGTLASVLLLMRKKIAITFFVVSFLALLIDMGHTFFAGLGADSYGPGGVAMPIMIFVIGAFLVWYSKNVTAKGWIS